jgi:hypothetical protein
MDARYPSHDVAAPAVFWLDPEHSVSRPMAVTQTRCDPQYKAGLAAIALGIAALVTVARAAKRVVH